MSQRRPQTSPEPNPRSNPQTSPQPSQTNPEYRIPHVSSLPTIARPPLARSVHNIPRKPLPFARVPDVVVDDEPLPLSATYIPRGRIPVTDSPPSLRRRDAIYIPNDSHRPRPGLLPSPQSSSRSPSPQSFRSPSPQSFHSAQTYPLDEPLPRLPTPESPSPQHLCPARTFEEMGIPHAIERTPSFLQRAATATRRAVVGRTQAEWKDKAVKTVVKALEEHHDQKLRAREAAVAAATTSTPRSRALRGELSEHELRALARAEHVYLTPRRTRHDFDDYALADGIVARVSGRGEDGKYVFLGSDGRLFVGRHDLGRGARPVPVEEERLHYSEAREIARAYYQLCPCE